jgi:hypothetical protein
LKWEFFFYFFGLLALFFIIVATEYLFSITGRELVQPAISFIQGVVGCYILYRKSLVLTQRFFYLICVSTAHQIFTTSKGIWKEDYKQSFSALDEKEFEDASVFKDMADELTPEKLVIFRITLLLGFSLFFMSRVWIVWRLVVDLMA